jgi:hypothetical protein
MAALAWGEQLRDLERLLWIELAMRAVPRRPDARARACETSGEASGWTASTTSATPPASTLPAAPRRSW